MTSKRIQALLLSFPLLVSGSFAAASESASGWLSVRNQNPFALDTGLPPAPSIPDAKSWLVDASLSIANTELGQSSGDGLLLFDGETRESRLGIAYAWNERWSARATLIHLRTSAGFLDGPVERFHDAFGFSNGDRGQLDTHAPYIEVSRGNQSLVLVDRPKSHAGPLLLDLTRQWQSHALGQTGLSVGLRLPTGSFGLAGDNDDAEVSVSAHMLKEMGDRVTFGARLGVLARNDAELLGAEAQSMVPFASLLLRYRLGTHWSAVLQADGHDALYHDLPGLLGYAGNQLSFGFARRLGNRGEFVATLGEDVPALHSADIALQIALRMRLGK